MPNDIKSLNSDPRFQDYTHTHAHTHTYTHTHTHSCLYIFKTNYQIQRLNIYLDGTKQFCQMSYSTVHKAAHC